jgi:polysaccharide biosynthesis/export protein
MLAILPNRQLASNKTRDRRQPRLLPCGIRIAAIVLLLGVSQRGWSQSGPAAANPDLADAATKQCSANTSQSQENAIRFVAPRSASAPAKVKPAQQPANIVAKPIVSTPPLTIADYENYIAEIAAAPRIEAPPASSPNVSHDATQIVAAAIPEPVEAMPVVEPSKPASQPAAEPTSRVASFAGSTAQLLERWFAKGNQVAEPRPAGTVIVPEQPLATTESQRPTPSVPTPPTTSDTTIKPVATPAAEPHVALLQPPPAKPTPAESRIENQPTQTDSLPMAAAAGPSMPLTTSNFLPANPESYCFRCGVKCPPGGCNPGGPGWAASRPIPWEVFAQGEYVGPARLAHVPIYRLRVDDQLAFVYRLSGQVSGQPYRLNVRDRVLVQSLSAPEVVNREVLVEPDGTITLPLLGQVRASGATLDELRNRLDEEFKRQIKDPRITVTPIDVNSNLQELRSSVDRRYGQGGQVSDARISPDGTVQLPAIGSVPAQGLTLEELEREIKARYAQIVEGLEVTPILTARAPRYVFVVGEVTLPGRYSMEGPTTLMQAITLAGSWKVGAQLNEVVVFRRDENWQLMATKVNIRESLLFKKPCPSGEIWLRDSDVVLVPKSPILCADDVINLVFTRGIYGVFPLSATLNFAKLSSL